MNPALRHTIRWQTRSARFAVLLASALMTAAIGAACSSFSADDAGTDAGGSGAEAGDGGDGGAVADAPVTPACAAGTVDCDPNNCGTTGHSCLGGDCVAGRCQPVLVGTSVGEKVLDIALDAQRVLWLTSTSGGWSGPGRVYACARGAGCAGAVPTSVSASDWQTGNLTGDGTTAYFSVPYGGGQAGVYFVDGSGQPQVVGNPVIEAVRLQVQGGLLYFVTLYNGGSVNGYAGTAYRGAASTRMTTAVGAFDSTTNYSEFVVVGTRMFFASSTVMASCTIGNCEKNEQPFTNSGAPFSNVVTDGTSVLWTDFTDVLSCAADQATCPTPTIVVGQTLLAAAPRAVTFAGGQLYIATMANDIFGCTLPDCAGTLTKLVHEKRLFQDLEPGFGHSLTADDTAVYWAAVDGMGPKDPDSGVEDTSALVHRIMKLAK